MLSYWGKRRAGRVYVNSRGSCGQQDTSASTRKCAINIRAMCNLSMAIRLGLSRLIPVKRGANCYGKSSTLLWHLMCMVHSCCLYHQWNGVVHVLRVYVVHVREYSTHVSYFGNPWHAKNHLFLALSLEQCSKSNTIVRPRSSAFSRRLGEGNIAEESLARNLLELIGKEGPLRISSSQYLNTHHYITSKVWHDYINLLRSKPTDAY